MGLFLLDFWLAFSLCLDAKGRTRRYEYAQLEIFWILSCKIRSLKWAVTSIVPAIFNILSLTVRFLEGWLASLILIFLQLASTMIARQARYLWCYTGLPKYHSPFPPICLVLEVSSKQPSLKGHSGDSSVVRQTDVFVTKAQDPESSRRRHYSAVSIGRFGFSEECAPSLCSGPLRIFGVFALSRTRTATGHVAAEPMAGVPVAAFLVAVAVMADSAIRRPIGLACGERAQLSINSTHPCGSFLVVCRKEPLRRTVHYRNCQSQAGFALKQPHPLPSRELSNALAMFGCWPESFQPSRFHQLEEAGRADDGHARATEGGAVEVCAETVRRDRTKKSPPCWNEKRIVECCVYIAAKQE